MAALCVLMYVCVLRLYNLNCMLSTNIATGRLLQCSTRTSTGSLKYRITIRHIFTGRVFP